MQRQQPRRDRDRAKGHQDIDRERARVARGQSLQPLGLFGAELALLHQTGDVENDLDGRLRPANAVRSHYASRLAGGSGARQHDDSTVTAH